MAKKLTPKQRAFIDHYFACGMNATQAAIKAGYSEDSAAVIGHENLRKPNVREEINRIFTENTMPVAEVLARLTEHARGDIGDLMDESGNIDIKKARLLGKTGLIKKIKRSVTTITDEQGNGRESFTDEIELHSSQTALQLIGKYWSLFTEKVEHSGSIQVIDLSTVEAEIMRRIEAGELDRAGVLSIVEDESLADKLFAGAAARVSAGKADRTE